MGAKLFVAENPAGNVRGGLVTGEEKALGCAVCFRHYFFCYNIVVGLEEIEQQEYFSIGEVRRITGVPEYSVRYWESEFGLIRPVRLSSGHRRYRKSDVYTILKIKDLIYKHKLTLEGAKKHLAKQKSPASTEQTPAVNLKLLNEIKETLADLLK